MKPANFRWTILITLSLAAASLLLIAANSAQTLVVMAASPVPTLNVAPLTVETATPTEEVAGPFAAMTQMSSTMAAIPTNTPVPSVSRITLDGKPHFVDFNATWCGPCNLMRGTVRTMKEKYGDRITFDNVDTDNPGSQALSYKYQVVYIPFMVFMGKDGKTIDMQVGYQTYDQLEASLKSLLEGKPRPPDNTVLIDAVRGVDPVR